MPVRILPVLLCMALAAPCAEFHVSPCAPRDGDGSRTAPFAGPVAARDGIRTARKDGRIAPDEPVTVILAPGDYRLTQPLALDARDSGASAAAPVTWRAAESGRVRIMGGVRIPAADFSPVKDPAVLVRLPETARGKVFCADVSAHFPKGFKPLVDAFDGVPTAPLFFIGGSFGTLARWPNDAYASFTKRKDAQAFIFSDPRARRWRFDEGVWLNGYWTHDWHNYSVRAASYGAEDGTNDVVRLAKDVPYGVMNGTWGRKERRFFVFNVLDELDAPGEWYIDRKTGMLYLYPPSGRPSDADDMVLTTLQAPLVQTVRPVAHLRFENLTFTYAAGRALHLSGDDIRVTGCRVLCSGASGLALSGNGNSIRSCEIAHIGHTAVTVDGGDLKTLRRADSVIADNHIHDFGIFKRTYAPGIWLGGCGLTLRANVIHGAPHSAIIYGGNEHLFEYNDVYDVLRETGDAGAYYTGRNWTTQGNVLRFNYTHDLGAGSSHLANTMGFYFDDCDCGDEVYGNIFHNVARGIMIGGGRDHPVCNNIFSRCLIGLSIDCRGMFWKNWNEPGGSWHLEGKALALNYTNGVWAAKYPRLAAIMADHPREPLYNPVLTNVFIDCTQQLLALDKRAPLERMAPIAGNVVINTHGTNGVACAKADPRIAAAFTTLNGSAAHPDAFGFADPASGDFRLRPGAALLKACPGFRPIPLERLPRAPKRQE